jgi:PQQ-dependent dehydrogenase (methanol/ethanol family)
VLLLGSCKSRSHQSSDQYPQHESAQNATAYAASLETDDGQWTRAAKDYASTRYSTLDQINTKNVGSLKVSFTFSLGTERGAEAAPIVVNNTMYLVTPFPNIVYALDLKTPGAPVKWSFDPHPSPASKGVACCDWVNRGAVYSDGRIFFNTLDGNTIALDATTGKQIWRTQVANIQKGETLTMAPLVIKDKVIIGNSGGEFGIRGWVKALNTRTGNVDWTAYTTGPDSDVLIGPRFHPFYSQYKGKDLGVKSWPPDAWKVGGGGMWGWMSYDPQLNLLYHGTANPGPWNSDERPGDNNWTAGIFARDPQTGEAVWFYQFSPHDLYDYDGINENILLDLPIQGQTRKVLVHPDRNGYMYVMDRATGQVLSANPYGHITTTRGVDLQSGELQYVEEKKPRFGAVTRDLCPSAPGAKDWQPSAFSPRTGLLYVPHNNLCMDEEDVDVNYIQGTPYVGANVRMYPGPGGNGGVFTAWDPVSGKAVWELKDHFPFWSGAVVTAGDLVFFGTLDGWFKAVDARSGQELWKFKTGSGVIGQPVVYRGPDQKQYVAVLSGVGGWAGAIVSGGLDKRDPTAGLGFVAATSDLPSATTKGGMLYVFSLP